MGIFGDMFDCNRDGKLDSFEKAAEFGAFMNLISDSQKDEISAAGLDVDELDLMDADERREALEGAGLDPDDYDFD